MIKNNILFLLHLPPPVHGSSMVGKFIYESKIINKEIKAEYLNLLASKTVYDSGRISLNKIISFINLSFKLFSKLVFNRFDLCYFALSTTGSAFLKDAILVCILKLFRVQILFHLHNKGVKEYSKKSVYNTLYKFVFKNSKVILLSRKLYYDIDEFVNENQVEICANGIPFFYNKINKNEVSSPVRFLFLSNLIESKGVNVLVEACSILERKNINFKLIIVGGEGDISEIEMLNTIKILGLEKKVIYLGKQYGEDKHNILTNSDIFVFPTFYHKECFPLVLLEASAYKLPIISCNEGGITDIVIDGKNGFIVSQKNVEELAQKMQWFINNPDKIISFGQECFNEIQAKFSLEAFEKRIKDILLRSIYK